MCDDYDRIWIQINGYNGYEWSNDELLRSMKNFNKYPQGNLLKKYKDKKGYYFLVTDNSNNKVKLYVDDIIIITTDKNSNQYKRGQYQTNIGSRNKVLVNKKKKKSKIDLNDNYVTKFTILQSEEPKNKEAIYFFK